MVSVLDCDMKVSCFGRVLIWVKLVLSLRLGISRLM